MAVFPCVRWRCQEDILLWLMLLVRWHVPGSRTRGLLTGARDAERPSVVLLALWAAFLCRPAVLSSVWEGTQAGAGCAFSPALPEPCCLIPTRDLAQSVIHL